jgi:prepilin-type processing-associated H-X9-DG protein
MIMKRFYLLALTLPLLSLCAAVQSQPPEPQPYVPSRQEKPRPREPEKQIEADLAAFVGSLNESSYLGATRFVSGARFGFFGASEWMEGWKQRHDNPKIHINNIRIDTLEADRAQVSVQYAVTPLTPLQVLGEDKNIIIEKEEILQLQRRGKAAEPRFAFAEGIWGIVVADTEEVLKKDPYSLERCALFIQQAPGIISIIRREESLYRLKSLALGALQFTQDFEEVYAFAPEYTEQALMPYLRDKRYFQVPGSEEAYAFNRRLSDLHVANIESPATTVLFYEGRDEQFTFRYDGKTPVCFTDGHVELLDAVGVKNVRWEPRALTAPAQ